MLSEMDATLATTDRYRRFIALWFECATLPDVALAAGIDRRAASNLASALRRQGVLLPEHRQRVHRRTAPNGPGSVDWTALARWAETCASAAAGRKYRGS